MVIVHATDENNHFRRLDRWGKILDDPHRLCRSIPTPWNMEESRHPGSKHSAYSWSEMVSVVWVGNAFGVYLAFYSSYNYQWAVWPASFWMTCGPSQRLWRHMNGECMRSLWLHQKENKGCIYSFFYSRDARGMSLLVDLQGRHPPCTYCTEPHTEDNV